MHVEVASVVGGEDGQAVAVAAQIVGCVKGATASDDVSGVRVACAIDVARCLKPDGCRIQSVDNYGLTTCRCIDQSTRTVDVESGTGIVQIGISIVGTITGYHEVVSQCSTVYYVWIAKSLEEERWNRSAGCG